MTIQETVRHFGGKRISKGKWIAKCPAHGDKKPSLSIREGQKTALIKCMSQGCELKEIVKASGLRMGDLYYESRRVVGRQASRAREAIALADDLVRECRRILIYRRAMWSRIATALAWYLFRNPGDKRLEDAYEYALDSCHGELLTWHHQDPPYSPFPVRKLLDGVTAQSLGQTLMPQKIARLLRLPA